MSINQIASIINDSRNAQDKDRAFTFIEFVKVFGFDKSEAVFLGDYKDYLTRWAAKKNENTTVSDEQFVREKLFEILKSITLTYSSYEEQQYIATIDWTDSEQIKKVIPLYVRKIREICEFYRKKRNEAFLIVEKNKQKGSSQSIEQIIYDKIFDYLFNNRNLRPQMAELKQDLHVSVEQFVDTFSEYYDIPRDENFRTNEDREFLIGANMNEVDYRNYIEINTVVNEILYSGEVYLEGLPLIANLGLDFSQECVGDMLALRDTLVANATIDLVPISEKISLKRKLYEKFVGCDLYYMYVDDLKDVKIDLLVKAANPSGNLLNCGNPDTAVTQSNELELLTHVGLFFKPDKTSILKINAHTYTWEIDKSKLLEDTVYVFPDPNRYGNIGNNKEHEYPLMMEYKLDRSIRNISSGSAEHDPLALMDDQIWSSYYSRQQDIFKTLDNKDYKYSFTSFANRGFVANYQTDVYGNEYGIFKGYKEIWKDGKLDHIEVSGNYPDFTYPDEQYEFRHLLLNGGYFEDPFNHGDWFTKNGQKVYVPGLPFNYNRELTFDENYEWTEVRLGKAPITTPSLLFDAISFGEKFDHDAGIQYIDHWLYTKRDTDNVYGRPDVVSDRSEFFETDLEEEQTPIVYVKKSFLELQKDVGTFRLRNNASLDYRPQTLDEVFTWLPEDVRKAEWVNYAVKKDCILLENDDEMVFVPFSYYGGEYHDNLGSNALIRLSKEGFFAAAPLWVERERVFYLAFLETYSSTRSTFVATIYKFDPAAYELTEVYCGWNFIPALKSQFDTLRKRYAINYFYLTQKRTLAQSYKASAANASRIDAVLFSGENNLENFEYNYEEKIDPDRIVFSYNSALNLYLLSYIINNNNGLPAVYEHKFKLASQAAVDRTMRSSVYSFMQAGNKTLAIWSAFPTSGKTSPNGEFFFVPN